MAIAGEFENPLLAGESSGTMPVSFEMENSPAQLAGRPIIIGAGLAGLMAALELSPRPVIVLTKSPLGIDAASAWSQGGLAAAITEDDSVELHLADTIAASPPHSPISAAHCIAVRSPPICAAKMTAWRWLTWRRTSKRAWSGMTATSSPSRP